MPINFHNKNESSFPAAYLSEVKLGRKTWEQHIIKEKNREHVQYNILLFKSTLKKPDIIEESKSDPECILYYKEIDKYCIRPGCFISTSQYKYFVVVVDQNNKFIKTVYISPSLKGGKKVWP